MKEVKLLNRVQAALHLSCDFTLATVQESRLKSELACFIHISNTKQSAIQLAMQS
jgi:hypothetical protein